ncbi:MAG: glucose-1-phosphate thymidylyltransferase RfbA [Myxococcota bacterium]
MGLMPSLNTPGPSHFHKGIVLAGGRGTRLYPLTLATSKQLLPIYDKPMVFYPLSVLMLMGIRDILFITTPADLPSFRRVLGDGAHLGVSFSYVTQDAPRGLADAFRVGADFIGDDNVVLILGDNLFYGQGLEHMLRTAASFPDGATIFTYPVNDPRAFGVAELNPDGTVRSLEEKPDKPRSRNAVTGLYFYDNKVVEYARSLSPSARGELEITDLNRRYLATGALRALRFGRGFAWLDTGTCESLLRAASFIEAVQTRQGFKIACLEEIAFRRGFIDLKQLAALAAKMPNTYGAYLRLLLEEEDESPQG